MRDGRLARPIPSGRLTRSQNAVRPPARRVPMADGLEWQTA
ncbi:hypothetical protein STIAU_4215, partial [Stigmatella aurantiaca DW4/3-1]